MKAERRHELQHNVLDAELAKSITFIKTRGVEIAWIAGILIVVSLLTIYSINKRRTRLQEIQLSFYQTVQDPALTPDERIARYRELANQDYNERLAAMASVRAGEQYLRKYILNPEKVSPAERENIAVEAENFYREVFSRFADQPLAVATAHLHLGRLFESKGDFARAQEEFQAVLAMLDMAGHVVFAEAQAALNELPRLAQPVAMATTAPAAAEPAGQEQAIPAVQ